MILEIIWLLLTTFHIVPVAGYLAYMRYIAKKRPWDIETDPSFEPVVSVIIPTYNEAVTIGKKLDNVLEADYPREKMEVVIVDSGSDDYTLGVAEEWVEGHPGVQVKTIRERERRGMVRALNVALKYVEGEVVVKTDADCFWLKDSLRNAVKYMTDPRVGSVAGLHMISARRETGAVKAEKTYREFYRILRIGESKLYSTVLYEGELMLVRRRVLEELGGFDEEIGADDVPTALRVAEKGYRAISSDDAYFRELAPYTWTERFDQKIRRARHVLRALWKYKYLNFGGNTPLHRLILPMETYIYVISPLLIVPLIFLSVALMLKYPWIVGLTLILLIGRVRQFATTHLTNTLIMQLAMLKEVKGKQGLTWRKIEEIR